ncbi:SMP-30/gluconolactonase/LRE family protein, partial [Streptomyces sp. SID10244]|nr:SMP-30/gluconolactonase/LRE family protein [Streptomyces sp. SID10244]
PGWSSPEVLCTFENGWPDGMAVTPAGSSWVALTGGDRVDLVDAAGEVVESIPVGAGSLPTNVCLGADDADELFVTASYQE